MVTRIQFRVTDDEHRIIEQNAVDAGYPNTSQFVKDLVLAYPNSLSNSKHYSFVQVYNDFVNTLTRKIESQEINAGDRFVLRDIDAPGWRKLPQHTNTPNGTIPLPLRASVGKQFFNAVEAGKFPNVKCAYKTDKYGTMIYEII